MLAGSLSFFLPSRTFVVCRPLLCAPIVNVTTRRKTRGKPVERRRRRTTTFTRRRAASSSNYRRSVGRETRTRTCRPRAHTPRTAVVVRVALFFQESGDSRSGDHAGDGRPDVKEGVRRKGVPGVPHVSGPRLPMLPVSDVLRRGVAQFRRQDLRTTVPR